MQLKFWNAQAKIFSQNFKFHFRLRILKKVSQGFRLSKFLVTRTSNWFKRF
jgi:hypothetical protein